MAETFDPRSVWFVGAGPGDRELITLKGYRLLQQAQVVIYAGSLINTDLLAYCPPGAECHDSAELHLAQILDLMEAGVNAGKTVVRLQTGDVSLYGSVREQGEELTKRGIDWQVVPGVSAFLGAAAELGVEYTVPEVSQSLIITRLEGRTPVPEKEQLEAFAAHQTSMAIFLSVQRIHRVAERLIEGGYPATTPVLSASRIPFSTDGINSLGTTPPLVASSKINPPPEGKGSTVITTWPYCPLPPD